MSSTLRRSAQRLREKLRHNYDSAPGAATAAQLPKRTADLAIISTSNTTAAVENTQHDPIAGTGVSPASSERSVITPLPSPPTVPDNPARTSLVVSRTEPGTSASPASASVPKPTVSDLNKPTQDDGNDKVAAKSLSAVSTELWDGAYDNLKAADPKLVESFEKTVSYELRRRRERGRPGLDDGTKGGAAETNTIAQHDPNMRRKQVAALVQHRQEGAEDRSAVREAAAATTKIVLGFKDRISSALEVYPPAALAFSGVVLLLDCLGTSFNAREANLTGLKYIISREKWYLLVADLLLREIPAIKDHTQLTEARSQFRKSLSELYKTLVEYQMKSVCKYYRYHRLVTFLEDQVSLNDWENDVTEIVKCETLLLHDMDFYNENIKQELELKQLDALDRLGDDLKALLDSEADKRERDLRREERERREELRQLNQFDEKTQRANRKIATAFTVPGIDYNYFKDGPNPKLVPGTGEWLKQHQLFKEWEEAHRSILVLSAPPGCGKSTLARAIADSFRAGAAQDLIVCHFFFKDSNLQGDACSAICAMVHQLLTREPHAAHVIRSRVEQQAADSLRRNLTELWSIFMELVKALPSKKFICVLDALDECAEDTRTRLVDFVTAEYMYEPGDANGGVNIDERLSGTTQLKFFLTTRPYKDILCLFAESRSEIIGLQARDQELGQIGKDIDCVIDHELGSLSAKKKLKPEVVKLLREGLKRVENRTYLWVKLVFEVLRKNNLCSSEVGWQKLVRELPKTAEEAYDALLSKIPEAWRGTVYAALSMVLVSFHPLSPAQLRAACCIYAELENDRGADLESRTDVNFSEWLADTCGFLVHEHKHHLSFIHQTVKEFLVATEQSSSYPDRHKDWTSWKGSIHPILAHRLMAEIGIKFGVHSCWSNPHPLKGCKDFSSDYENYPRRSGYSGWVWSRPGPNFRKVGWRAHFFHCQWYDGNPSSIPDGLVDVREDLFDRYFGGRNLPRLGREWDYRHKSCILMIYGAEQGNLRLLSKGIKIYLAEHGLDSYRYLAIKRYDEAIRCGVERDYIDVVKCLLHYWPHGESDLAETATWLLPQCESTAVAELLRGAGADSN